jgi:galactokinase
VTLICEYADLSGGYVMPMAIDLGTYFAVRPSSTNTINAINECVARIAADCSNREPPHVAPIDNRFNFALLAGI